MERRKFQTLRHAYLRSPIYLIYVFYCFNKPKVDMWLWKMSVTLENYFIGNGLIRSLLIQNITLNNDVGPPQALYLDFSASRHFKHVFQYWEKRTCHRRVGVHGILYLDYMIKHTNTGNVLFIFFLLSSLLCCLFPKYWIMSRVF